MNDKRTALAVLLELKKQDRYDVYISDREGNKYYLDDAIDRLYNNILAESLNASDLKIKKQVIEKIERKTRRIKLKEHKKWQ